MAVKSLEPSPKQRQKRFIAGAVCPKCYAADKTLAYEDPEKYHRECVACGFQEELEKGDPQ